MNNLLILLISALLVSWSSAGDSWKKGGGVHYEKGEGIRMLDAETFR